MYFFLSMKIIAINTDKYKSDLETLHILGLLTAAFIRFKQRILKKKIKGKSNQHLTLYLKC